MVYSCGWGTASMMSSWWGFGGIIFILILLSLVILVFLWIVKLWKQIQGKNEQKKKGKR